jgi:hypothetical protein
METNSNTSSPRETPDAAQPINTIECEACRSMGFSYLEYEEVEAVLCNGTVSRYCHVCNKQTMWRRAEIPRRQSGFYMA